MEVRNSNETYLKIQLAGNDIIMIHADVIDVQEVPLEKVQELNGRPIIGILAQVIITLFLWLYNYQPI